MTDPAPTDEQVGCCPACGGRGGTGYDGPCSDCLGTGHPHPPDPTCGVADDREVDDDPEF